MLHPPRFISDDDASGGQHFYLLGLIRGHWRQRAEADFADNPVESDMQQLNTGIAIVTPIAELFSIFGTQRFIDYRAEMEQKLDASQPVPE